MEQKINVTERDDGRYSINLKEIELNKHIILTKINEMPLKEFEKDFGQGPKKSYLWIQKLDDLEVSFFLTAKQNEKLIEVGKLNDKIKVTRIEATYENKKTDIKLVYKTFNFEVVN